MRTIRHNPYQGVNWETQLKADMHFHTVESDGQCTVKDMVEAYAALGFDVLSITDHDFCSTKITWPWSDYGVDAETLGIIPIKGCELSWYVEPYHELNQHHICSYFNDYRGYEGGNEQESMQEIGARNGLAVFAHPNAPSMHPAESAFPWWYLDFYKNYPHILGQEIRNQLLATNYGEHWNNDVRIWDYVLQKLAPLGRNVYGLITTDAHRKDFIGCGYILILAEKNEQSIRTALENGHFVAVMRDNPTDTPPVINDIAINDNIISITASNYDTIRWVTNDIRRINISGGYKTYTGDEITTGDSIDIKSLPLKNCYVRAIIEGTNARIYTNPFLIWQNLWVEGNFVNS